MAKKPAYEELVERIRALEQECAKGRQAEERLKESEAKYRTLFENLPEEVHFWQLVRDEDGRIKTWRLVDANPPTLRTWRKTLNEIRGKTTDEIFGPGATDHYMPAVRKIMTEGIPFTFEDYFPNLDRHFRFTSFPFGDYFITTGVDITGKKQAEEALQKERHQLRERVKELECLYSFSELIEKPGISLEEILQGTADLLPSGWQYPDAARARIILDGHEYTSNGFEKSKWRLAEDIVAHGRKVGAVEVFYVNEGPKSDDGPFLKEERGLIHAVAGRLGRITERIRAEEALRKERERLGNIIEATRVGTWEWNVQTGETTFNERWAEIVGYTLKELAPVSIKTWESLVHPDDLKKSDALLEGHFSGALPYYDCECRMKHKDGYWVWVLDRGQVISRTADDKPLMMFGTHTDITERKRAEEAIRASENQFRNLIDCAGDAIFVLDLNSNRILDCNRQACLSLGYSHDEILRLSAADIEVNLSPREIEAIHAELGRQGISNVEGMHRRRDSSVFPVEIRLRLLDPPNSHLAVSIVRDISERKRAEKEALDLKNTQLNSFINNIPDLAWIKDSESKYIAANEAFAQTVGMTPEFLVNNSCEVCFGETEGRKFREEDRKVMESRRQIVLEEEVFDPQGKQLWLETIKSPIFDDSGKVIGTVGIARDITERMRAKEVLQQSEKKLRLLSSHLLSAQEAERKRIAKELHDQLGQDLVGLKLHLGSIKRQSSEGKIAVSREFESVQEDIDQIIENVRRLSRDLGPYALEHLGLWQALRYLTESMAKHFLVKSSFAIDNKHNGLPQSAQLNIFRVFQEALTNIQKHADAAHVSIEVGKRNGNLSFLIEDDGKGFDLTRVMEKGPAEKGLGLVIMEERVRMLGGVFDIWSQEGKGSRISFTVPVDREGEQR